MHRVIVVILAVLLLLSVYVKGRQSRNHAALTAFDVYSSPATQTVKVSGAVRHPGIYYLSANIMAVDAIKMAEPLRSCALFTTAHIAIRPVKCGTELRLTLAEDNLGIIAISQIPTAERLVLGLPLDMTSMNAADFEQLPGIGPALAERIVAYRQKNGGKMRPEDLEMVDGIGDKTYAALIGYFK